MIELDKRIIEGKKPLTAFDELDSKYIGTDCFFSDKPSDFADLSKCQVGKLMSLDAVSGMFGASKNNSYAVFYFCLPCEWVEEPEKKYRPLSFKEFWRLFDFGDGVCFRRKGQDTAEFSMFLGYEIDSDGNRDEIPGEGKVNLGGNRYTLAELFEYYEMKLDDEWQPFGVLEND